MITEDMRDYAKRISNEVGKPIYLQETEEGIQVEVGDSYHSAKYICVSDTDFYTFLNGVSVGYKITNFQVQHEGKIMEKRYNIQLTLEQIIIINVALREGKKTKSSY